VSERASPDGKRKLCVGRGERCFACGGRGSKGLVLGPPARASSPTRACPVCGGRGRTIVVDSGDGRTGLCERPS
jgi:DnaJ-class molecular chaperone